MNKDVALHKVGVRQKLAPRREPYWGPRLAPNQSLGYRKIDADTGSWVARLKKDGKRTYRALGMETEIFGFDQAHAAAVKWFTELDKGISGVDLTVRDACENYVTSTREQKKKPETAHDAEKRFERVVYESTLAKVRLCDLRKHHIQTWIDAQTMKPASLVRTLSSLKAALNLAVKKEQVGVEARQAWTALEIPDVPDNRRALFLSLKQRRALLKATKGGLHDLIQGAMLTGCRAGELTSALCKQFDAHANTMTFIGKTGSRTVPLPAPTLALFKRLTKDKPADAHIFTRDDGLRWNHSDWDEHVKSAAKAAGLPDATVLYTLRHTFISEAISGGLSTLEVARFVGTSLQMIEKHYGKMIPDATLARMGKLKFA